MPEMVEKESQPTEDTPTDEVSSGLGFELKPITEKPRRAYRKGSKYDPIIDSFKSSRYQLVNVDVKGKEANYLRTQLNKRLEHLKLTKKIEVSVVNNVCYLEKIKN